MAMFDTVSELENFLKDIIGDALFGDIADVVKDYESASAMTYVYGAYNPEKYGRRYSLADQGNMEHDVDYGSLTLTVKNDPEFNPGYDTSNYGKGLVELVEYGNGGGGHYYEYLAQKKTPTYLRPRPFIEKAREEIRPEIRDLMKQALINQGLDVH